MEMRFLLTSCNQTFCMEFCLGPGREVGRVRHTYLPRGSISLLPESEWQFSLVGKDLFDLDHELPNLVSAYKIKNKNDVSGFFPYQFRYFHVNFKILPVQNYTWK